LLQAGAGATGEQSFAREAVFFVSGMLPRQFAAAVQGQVRRFFSGGSASVLRTVPLTMIRGIGPDVEERLEEEGIYDVSSLAYVKPHQLIRATTFGSRQIVDWIDEALLIATLPDYWQQLEKLGVTGALDLSWFHMRTESIESLATEIRMPKQLLADTIARLAEDAQVGELNNLYWEKPDSTHKREVDKPATVAQLFKFKEGTAQDARERLIAIVGSLRGVQSTNVAGDVLTTVVEVSERETVEAILKKMQEIEPA
jgi:hypothetical protein